MRWEQNKLSDFPTGKNLASQEGCTYSISGISEITPEVRRAASLDAFLALWEVTRDRQAHTSSRVAAARSLAEIGGLLGAGRRADHKELQEMTAVELHATMSKLEGELSKRSTDVTPAWRATPNQATDILD
jgi:hypothetical protein